MMAVLLLLSVLLFTMLGAASAHAITRDEVLARAQRLTDFPVAYSQSKYHAGYRTDCSGYVSMCWNTKTSWSTRSFHLVSHRISVKELLPGDALLKKGYHIRLFYGWLDDTRTHYLAYESSDGQVAKGRVRSMADDLAFGYIPTRYDRIRNSPKPRNVLLNGSFKVWESARRGRPDLPVWWQSGTQWWETPALRRSDTYRSAHSSLELTNPSEDPLTYTEISQVATVVAGVDYRLTAWAKTDSDPAGVELRLVYLDGSGESVAETTTMGNRFGIDGLAFRRLSILYPTPPDAVRAHVTIRLAGGSATDESGTVVAGTSVLLDDISLSRPQVTAAIKASASTARSGTAVTLGGSVTPTVAIGAPATIHVKRPGAAWAKLSTSDIHASGNGAAWKGKFGFTRSMPRGTYRFKVTIPPVPGHLGTTTSSVSVILR